MDVREVQQALTTLGYDPGPVDGVWGAQSAEACKQFQRDSGLTADGIPGPATQALLAERVDGEATLEVPAVLPMPHVMDHAKALGHKVWGDPWRLWLFGVRSPVRTVGTFDDALGVCWTEGDGYWRCEWWPGTTDPGKEYMLNPSRSAGCAILVADQYLDTWTIDKHAGKYDALCQRAGEVSVYRDGDRDLAMDLDPVTIRRGYFGINLHASTQRDGAQLETVGRYSAGCQVHASADGFKRMMELARLQVSKTGRKTFSYTLMDQWW